MKFMLFVSLLALLFAALALSGPTIQRSVIVSYPNDTPNSVLDEAKAAVLKSGGTITHEYKLIKAFAAKASEKALETVQTYGQKYNALIEDDQQLHAQGGHF